MPFFLVLYVAGASMIAGWLFVRFPSAAPADLRRALAHAGVALVACRLIAPVATEALISTNNPVLRLFAVIGVTLPAFVYGILSFVWILVLLQGATRRGMLR
jgi:hypothetical protein